MAKEGKFVAPVCPECGKLLDTVHESEHDTYVFNPQSGGYTEDAMSGTIDIDCPYCGTDVRDTFEEGACNYQSTERVNKRGKGRHKTGTRSSPTKIVSMRT